MHLVLFTAMVFLSFIKAQGDAFDCSNYEDRIMKRYSLGPFLYDGGLDFGELLYRGPQEQELYLSDFFDVSSVTSAEYIECEEKVTLTVETCWVDTFTVQIYSNGVIVERGQTIDWYLVSGKDVDLNSEIAIGDSKERVLEVLGKPRQMHENRWLYTCNAVSAGGGKKTTVALRFIDGRLGLISVYIGYCLE
ncbi:hypothetical protein QA601_18275 [Chitinispirillales bacterium ANBcel5]|uniref:hypothetical protein n=1 Tax=Cellulosispirillum alkaliphilum TaxID=3039283 RepID=UPI002A5601FF|nr:hypothetical protein [Chitinispirillales bacterium ANBcel5]